MIHYDFDLFVIGAGSGGVRAARVSAGMGAKVCIAEEYRVGGTCVIRGCVPKKLFVYASHYADHFEDAGGFGWRVGDSRFDWPTLIANKDKEIDRLNSIYIRNLERSGVTLVQSRAVVKDAHTIYLEDEKRTVTAQTILIATGGRPFVPEFPGSDLAITSNEAFHLEELPSSIVVVGGGYIAVEFAGIFSGLGVDVTLVYRGDQILRGFDQDMRQGLSEALTERGVKLRMDTKITSLEKSGGAISASFDDGSDVVADVVMYATGRVPNTEGLGLENINVALGGKGEIIVDEYSRTSEDNIYAVGDVTDRVNLTPVAIREGMAFTETVFRDNPTSVDYELIPTAVFSQPEIGTVGLTEEEARSQYGEIDIYKSSFRPMKHTLSGRSEKMIMKLIVDAATDKVLGCHVLGDDAAEMIQMTAIAMKMGATKADFDATVALHPCAAEELVTMREKWQASS